MRPARLTRILTVGVLLAAYGHVRWALGFFKPIITDLEILPFTNPLGFPVALHFGLCHPEGKTVHAKKPMIIL